MKKIITILAFILFWGLPATSLAVLQLNYPVVGGITIDLDMNLNDLVAWFYYFLIAIAGLCAFFMIVWGGVTWLTSAGNPSKISEAKDRLSSAFLGLVLVLASWLILQVINPDITALNLQLSDVPACSQ